MSWVIDLAERRVLPDPVVRVGMHRLLGARLREERRRSIRHDGLSVEAFVDEMRAQPVAVATADANEQHYELPAEFFATVLGPNLKYSSCLWNDGVHDLAQAEDRMLELTCERAGIDDGMEVIDLGCGWGSFSRWVVRHYPRCRVLAVSNSRTQAEFIRARCQSEALDRLEVVTADMNHFEAPGQYDRIVSVEMFEHMRNWGNLLAKTAGWLNRDGKFFIHIFTHRTFAYPF